MEQPPPLRYDDDGVGRPDWSQYRGWTGARRRHSHPRPRTRALGPLVAGVLVGIALAGLAAAGLWLMILRPEIGAGFASPVSREIGGTSDARDLTQASGTPGTLSASTHSTATASSQAFPLCPNAEPHHFEQEVTEFGIEGFRWETHRHSLTVPAEPDCWSGQVILPVGSWEIRVSVEGGNDTAYLLKQPSGFTRAPEPDDTLRQNGPIHEVTASAPFSEAGQRTKYRVRGTGDVHFCLVRLQMGHEPDASHC